MNVQVSIHKTIFFKYSNETAILSLLFEDYIIGTIYQPEISRFVDWCDNNNLVINTKKTEEIILECIGDHRTWL